MGLLFAMITPLIIAGVALYGVGRGVDVYDALIHGGAEGLEVLLRIVPSLIALMTAVYMLRASGALELAAREALAELGMDTAIDHVTDFTQIAAYGVMTTPALVVDGKVVSYGKVLKKDEAKALIQKVRENA